MHPLSRAFFTATPLALLFAGFMLHLQTPMALPGWIAWFSLSAVALGLLARALRPVALKRRHRRAAPYEAVPKSAKNAYAAATAAGFAYFLAVVFLPVWIAAVLVTSVHMGQWLCLLFMPFAAAVAGAGDEGWLDIASTFIAAVVPLPMILLTADNYSARMWLVSVAPVYAIVPGSRRLKIVAGSVCAALIALAWASSHFGLGRLLPFFSWIFEGRSPLAGSYMLSLQHAVYQLAGPAGAGAEYIPMVELVRGGDMSLNGVPYLALWLGTRAAKISVFAVAALLVGAFAEILYLRSPARRAVCTGLWFLCACNFYTSVLALFFPEFLSISYGAWGIPFIGSFESSLQLLLLLIIVFTGEAAPARAKAAPAPEPYGPPDAVPPGPPEPAEAFAGERPSAWESLYSSEGLYAPEGAARGGAPAVPWGAPAERGAVADGGLAEFGLRGDPADGPVGETLPDPLSEPFQETSSEPFSGPSSEALYCPSGEPLSDPSAEAPDGPSEKPVAASDTGPSSESDPEASAGLGPGGPAGT
ncbi:MAG: hypothetical protein LBQ12_04125 [Deltaproteobacteria bacterium]|jgi:hypothetical protein|nr:hypothetical protein [Deltaproteobacteria bacterium]